MSDFTLVNLYSQREAVANYVAGWEIERIIEWMRNYGRVSEPQFGSTTQMYTFESKAGFKDAFRFTSDNSLEVVNSGWIS